jgi:hypothetical protein
MQMIKRKEAMNCSRTVTRYMFIPNLHVAQFKILSSHPQPPRPVFPLGTLGQVIDRSTGSSTNQTRASGPDMRDNSFLPRTQLFLNWIPGLRYLVNSSINNGVSVPYQPTHADILHQALVATSSRLGALPTYQHVTSLKP